MYYYKGMKRTALACCMCLWPLLAGAQSTCETRVDAHPHASTMQRVDYCLNSNYDAVYNNPGLVFSGVTPRHPAAQQSTPKGTAHESSFKADKVTEEYSFVNTQQFPQLKNATLSEREIWEVHQEAAKQLPAVVQPEPIRQPVEKQMKPLPQITESKAGIVARTKKPQRRFMQVTKEETALTAAGPVTQEVAPAADEYTYDTVSTQSYAPATPDAQEYVPATPEAQEYVPAEVAAEPYAPYAPAGQEEILGETVSYAPAN